MRGAVGDGNRAALGRRQCAWAIIGLGKSAGNCNLGNGQIRATRIGKRHRLGSAGGAHQLIIEIQRGWRESGHRRCRSTRAAQAHLVGTSSGIVSDCKIAGDRCGFRGRKSDADGALLAAWGHGIPAVVGFHIEIRAGRDI